MYTTTNRIRFSECDRSGKLKISGMIDLFQDCSTFQSEDLGIGVDHLHDKKMAWVLSTWNVEIKEYPVYGQSVTVGTMPYEVKGFFGKRNFVIRSLDGKDLCVADSLWMMIDLQTGKPVRVPDEVINGYELEDKLPMEYTRSRIEVPKDREDAGALYMTRHYIDSNGHVNNGKYIEMAMDAVPDIPYKRLRAEYHRQAMEKDRICLSVYNDEKKHTVVLSDASDDKYCIVRFEE